MKRLRRMGGTRKYETFDVNEAKNLALQYAKEDGMHFAVIQVPESAEPYEIFADDEDLGPEAIPGLVYYTAMDIKDIDDYHPFHGKSRERMPD